MTLASPPLWLLRRSVCAWSFRSSPRLACILDNKSGNEVGAVYMPAPQTGSPMTYSYDGKQYIMVAVSGGNYSGDYLAYALPQGQ